MTEGAGAAPLDGAGDAALDEAFDDFVAALADVGAFVRRHPFYADAENRASAYAFLANVLVARIEENLVWDPALPFFRIIDPRSREGADNGDQRYLVTRLVGGETYRVWGRIGSARRIELQVYAGDPYLEGGRSASCLGYENLAIADDGTFAVLCSPSRQGDNWLENPADATKLFVRLVYSDWSDDDPGEVHIDRVGHEGDLRPPFTADDMARRLTQAAGDLRTHARIWPTIVGRILDDPGPNRLGPPRDSGAQGGVPGRFMVNGSFDLADDEALIVRTWPASGNYQGIQLLDLWMEGLEYANRQTTLSGDQAHLGADGSYHFVISARDPGVANWLDTVGRRRGMILLRYDGTIEETFDPAQVPTATKVKLADLAAHLPPGTPIVSPEERRRAIAARRKHVQIRFGN